MPVTRINFKAGRVLKPHEYDGKNCRNCAHCNDGHVPTSKCLSCIRFGHTDGIVDNWQPREDL